MVELLQFLPDELAAWPELTIVNKNPIPPLYWGLVGVRPNRVDGQLLVDIIGPDGPARYMPVAFIIDSDRQRLPVRLSWHPDVKHLRGQIKWTTAGGSAEWQGGTSAIFVADMAVPSTVVMDVYPKVNPPVPYSQPHHLLTFEYRLFKDGQAVPSLSERVGALEKEMAALKGGLDESR